LRGVRVLWRLTMMLDALDSMDCPFLRGYATNACDTEIGLRMALGARRPDYELRAWVIGDKDWIAAAGAVNWNLGAIGLRSPRSFAGTSKAPLRCSASRGEPRPRFVVVAWILGLVASRGSIPARVPHVSIPWSPCARLTMNRTIVLSVRVS